MNANLAKSEIELWSRDRTWMPKRVKIRFYGFDAETSGNPSGS